MPLKAHVSISLLFEPKLRLLSLRWESEQSFKALKWLNSFFLHNLDPRMLPRLLRNALSSLQVPFSSNLFNFHGKKWSHLCVAELSPQIIENPDPDAIALKQVAFSETLADADGALSELDQV